MKVDNKLFTIQQTSEILNISKSTLRDWDRTKYFIAGRTKGKHRRYTSEQINEIKDKISKGIEK